MPRQRKSILTSHRKPRLLAAAGIAALSLAACGSDPVPISAPADGSSEQAQAAPAPAGPAAVTSSNSPLGDILVGSNGLAVYGFTNDVDAASVCYGTCAEAWPPVLVDANWDVAPGLDAGIFNAVAREDGQLQLVAGRWPLYYFAGDAVPTDLNGQGSGGVWFAVSLEGTLVTDDAPAEEAALDEERAEAEPAETPTDAETQAENGTQNGIENGVESGIVAVGETLVGNILVDEAGLSLYGFLDDDEGNPTCEGACADAWPPLLVDSAELPAGLDSSVFSVAERLDGTFQLKAGTWPLYRFAGDAAAGDVNGQASGGVWFLATPDGGLIKDTDQAAAQTESDDDY